MAFSSSEACVLAGGIALSVGLMVFKATVYFIAQHE